MERQGVRFKLTSGETVEAKQDCPCFNHEGPHWLYMNDLWRDSNRKLLSQGNVRGHIHEELPRLQEKRREMEQRGIVEIVH